MEESRLNRYGLKKIVPTVIELRRYLYQCTFYTDKRCYIPISFAIEDFISKKNIGEMNYEQIASVLLYFEIMPECLYFYVENNGNPDYYEKIEEINTTYGNLLILSKLGGEVVEFANFTGALIIEDWWGDLDKISWAESSIISNYEIQSDGTILVWFVGRNDSWAVFEYYGLGFLLKDAGSDFKGKRNPSQIDIAESVYVENDLFDLMYRVPLINDLRAYLYQLAESDFGMSNDVRKELNIIDGISSKLAIDKLTDDDVRILLNKVDVFPKRIFYFKAKFDLLKKIQGDTNQFLTYDNYPPLFSNIKSVSFDEGGFIAMEFFASQIYKLYTSSGKALTDYCHDLDLLTEGRFVSRSSGKSGGFKVSKYNSKSKSCQVISEFGDLDPHYNFLPYLNNRDVVREMYFPNNTLWKEMNSFNSNSENEEVDFSELNSEFKFSTSRRLVNLYENDRKLALSVLKHHPEAFSLLSDALQNDRKFILQALSNKYNIYNYLSQTFKNEREIILLALNETDLDGEIVVLLSDSLKNDKEILLAAIKKSTYGSAFEYFPSIYKNDREFLLEVLKLNGQVLRMLTENFKNDRELVLAAVQSTNDVLQYASEFLKQDIELIKIANQMREAAEAANDDLPF
jgi:hypothetical protein